MGGTTMASGCLGAACRPDCCSNWSFTEPSPAFALLNIDPRLPWFAGRGQLYFFHRSCRQIYELIESTSIDPMGPLTDQQRAEREEIYKQHVLESDDTEDSEQDAEEALV